MHIYYTQVQIYDLNVLIAKQYYMKGLKRKAKPGSNDWYWSHHTLRR